MKFKLDENFGKRTQQIFRMSGHDVQTVREEELQGSPDQSIYSHCCREQRCLVTLDLDFADVTRFPPPKTVASLKKSILWTQSCPGSSRLQRLARANALGNPDGRSRGKLLSPWRIAALSV